MASAVRMGGVDAAVDDTRSLRFAGRRRPMSEAALVRAAQAGSERAVEELFARHWDDAYRAALLVTHDRAAAEDIAQEAFLAALRALPRFDRRRPLRPWLHRIVVNRAIDFARRRRLRREVDGDAVPEAPAHPDAPLAELGSLGPAIAALGSTARGDRPALPARHDAGRDRRRARPAARDRQLAAATRLDALGERLEDKPS